MGKAVKRETRGKRAEVNTETVVEHALPVLNEAMFQQILEAAFVLQQQNDLQQQQELRQENDLKRAATPRKLDPAETLAQIAETQELLRSHSFDLKAAARLIADRLSAITNAAGLAIAVIRGDQLEYCAAAGDDLPLEGSGGTIDSALSAFLNDEATLRRFQGNSQLSRDSVDSHNYPLLFPIYHEGRISGLLQLSYADSESIEESEIRSCQMMAGLMGEAIARATELEWKQALAAERATMLDALERLRPQLERLVDPAAAPAEAPQELSLPDIPALREANKLEQGPDLNIRESSVCKQCGYQFGDGEMFCGRCGTPRTLDFSEVAEPLPDVPSTDPTAQMQWDFEKELPLAPEEPEQVHMRDHFSRLIADGSFSPDEQPVTESEAGQSPVIEGTSALTIREAEPEIENAPVEVEAEVQEVKPELVVVPRNAEVLPPSPFGSASGALRWLRSLEQANSPSRRWLDTHRGDLAIGAATLILIIALSGWGSRPVQSQSKLPAPPRLSLFERMLVTLGVAEPPATQPYSGNPNIQVWEDVHHALYYCPGSDLYGKTPDGKFTTQGDAQLDQFQPAARKDCE